MRIWLLRITRIQHVKNSLFGILRASSIKVEKGVPFGSNAFELAVSDLPGTRAFGELPLNPPGVFYG